MNAETDQALTRAYELIEQERFDEAQAVLKPVLASEKDNADAWWLYAHAVTDVDSAREAIQNVLRVDPSYPEARELLASLENTVSPPRPIRPIERIGAQSPATLPTAPPTLPEGDDSQFDLSESVTEPEPRRLLSVRQIAILLPVLLIVIVGGLLALLNSTPPAVSTVTPTFEEQVVVPTLPVTTPLAGDTDAPTAAEALAETPQITTATAETTEEPTATTEVVSTDEVIPTEEISSENNFDTLYEALSTFTIPRNGIEVSRTDMGDTLLVTVCTNAGPDLRTDLNDVMRIIANNSPAWARDVDAVGARMVNCGANSTLLLIGVAVEDAVAFAEGELDENSFHASWVSQ